MFKFSMFKLFLQRAKPLKDRTIGILYLMHGKDTLTLFYTLELPYNANIRCKSSIPKGTYTIKHYFSKKFKNCFEVLNVPDRTDILIHSGNYPKDTQGCILIGKAINKKSSTLLSSRAALTQLNQWLEKQEETELTIE